MLLGTMRTWWLIMAALVCAGACTGDSQQTADLEQVSQSATVQSARMTVSIPTTVDVRSLAVAGSSTVKLGNNCQLLRDSANFADSSNGSGKAEYGTDLKVGSITAAGPVQVLERSTVSGPITAGGSITFGSATPPSTTPEKANVTVTGPVTPNASVVMKSNGWTVPFNVVTSSPQTLKSNQTLEPGSYGSLDVQSTVTLKPGTYYIDTLRVQQDSKLVVLTSGSPTCVYVRTTLESRGIVEAEHPENVLFGYLGTQTVPVEKSFAGTIVAPNATVDMGVGNTPHVGSVFAKGVVLEPNVKLTLTPFSNWKDLVPDLVPGSDGGTDGAGSAGTGAGGSSGASGNPGGASGYGGSIGSAGSAGSVTDGGTGGGTADTGSACQRNSDCKSGLMCWANGGPHFGQPWGTSVCAAGLCLNGHGLCGMENAECGRFCDVTPTQCSSDADCSKGQVCGQANGARFGLSPNARVCWAAHPCSESPNAPPNCGTFESTCGSCDCSANCANKKCGDDPADGCGHTCPGICKQGQSGCHTDLECSPGNVCGIHIGAFFGLSKDANVCWNELCGHQDTSRINCGLPTDIDCGQNPECPLACSKDVMTPDGGYCGDCGEGKSRLPNGTCNTCKPVPTDNGSGFTDPLPAHATDPVGAIPASFTVSDSGTAVYSIPIQVPPGRRGMQPALSLVYESNKHDGMLGVGWKLAGLSAIERCNHVLDRDGKVGAVSFTADDTFCLDGQALVYSRDTDTGKEYRTEIDSFARIIAVGPEQDALGEYIGPRSFRVFTKDGRRLELGHNDDSAVSAGNGVKRIWAVDHIEDRAGNTIEIEYQVTATPGLTRTSCSGDICKVTYIHQVPGPTSEIVPSVISYGGTWGHGEDTTPVDASRFVKFLYELRPDIISHRAGGLAGFTSERLTAIETYVENQLIRTYHVDYEQNRADNLSRVQTIRECAPEQGKEVCKGAGTQFEYIEAGGFGGSEPAASIESYSALARAVHLDLDGDGKDELLAYATDMKDFRTAWLMIKTNSSGVGLAAPVDLGSIANGDCINQNSVIDLNRDGKDDLVSFCPASDSWQVRVLLSTGSTFNVAMLPFTLSYDPRISRDSGAALADLDGDGLRDFYRCGEEETPEDGSPLITVHRNTGSTFETEPKMYWAPARTRCANMMPLDIDGDGREEIVVRKSDQGMIAFNLLTPWTAGAKIVPEVSRTLGSSLDCTYWKLVDFNGDGLKDIVIAESPGKSATTYGGAPYVYENVGGAFRVFQPMLHRRGGDTGWQIDYDGLVMAKAIDYDGDGREDLATRNGYYRLASSQPYTLEFVPAPIPETGPGFIADLRGEGNQDLIQLTQPTDSTVAWVYHGASRATARANLLKRVTDGDGKQIDVEYISDKLDDRPHYAQTACQNTDSVTCMRKVTPLVRSHYETEIAAGGISRPGDTYRYAYSNARVGAKGRGSFGFESRTITRLGVSTETRSFHNDGFFLAGRLKSSTTVLDTPVPADSFSNAVSQRVVSATFVWETQQGDFRKFPYVHAEVHSTQDGQVDQPPLVHTSVTRDVDLYGTMTTEIARTYSGPPSDATQIGFTIVERKDILNDSSSWTLGLVRDETTTMTRGARSAKRRAKADYTPTGLLRYTEREPDAIEANHPERDPSLYRKVQYDLDTYGNVTSTCVTDSRGASYARCARVTEFDPWYISPATVVNEGLSTHLVFSAKTGALLVSGDPNGQVSEFGYDAFGRIQQVRTPTASETYTYQVEKPSATPFPDFTKFTTHSITIASAGGGTTVQYLDGFGRETGASTSGIGASVLTEREYGNHGQLTKGSLPHVDADASQGVVTYQYDGFQRVSSEQHPDGSTVQYFYPNARTAIAPASQWFTDADAIEASVVQKPKKNIDAIVRDSWGKAVRSVQAEDATLAGQIASTYVYGAFNVLTQIHGPVGDTSIIPDGLGRTTDLTDPAMGPRKYVYDGFDEITQVTDGNGRVTKFGYDRLGRQTSVSDVNDKLIAKRNYDGAGDNELGRVTGIWRQSKPDSSTGNWVRYHYQKKPAAGGVNRGMLQSISYGMGGTADAPDSGDPHEIGFVYRTDVPWWVGEIHYPGTGVSGAFGVQYDYDLPSGITTAAHPTANPAASYWKLSETYQGYKLKTETFGNGVTTTRGYYDVNSTCEADWKCQPGRLRSIETTLPGNRSLPPVQAETFLYDANGNLGRHDSKVANAPSTTYKYRHDRLENALAVYSSSVQSSEDYRYDDAGNLTFKTSIGTYNYDPIHPFQVKDVGGVSFLYDDNGNTKNRAGTAVPGGSQSLEYNEFNMPWRITNGTGETAVPVELEYDGNGSRLIKRQYSGSSVAKISLTLADLYEQVAEYAGGTTEPASREHRYRVFAAGREVAQVRRVETGGTVAADQTFYLHDDPLGTTSAITGNDGDGEQMVKERRRFLAFGEEDLPSSTWSTTGVMSGFTGHQHDLDLGLVNMKGRLYDPRLSRFVTPDPFVTEPFHPQGLNRYSYVQNNPLAFVDPTGFENEPAGAERRESFWSKAWSWVTGSGKSGPASPQPTQTVETRSGTTPPLAGAEGSPPSDNAPSGAKGTLSANAAAPASVEGGARDTLQTNVAEAVSFGLGGGAPQGGTSSRGASEYFMMYADTAQAVTGSMSLAAATVATAGIAAAAGPAVAAAVTGARVWVLGNLPELVPAGADILLAAAGAGGGVGAGRGANAVRGFHGTTPSNILGILNARGFIPKDGKVFLSQRLVDTFVHGVDEARGAAFSIEVELSVAGARVTRTSTHGNPAAVIIESGTNLSAAVERMFVRSPRDGGGFVTTVVEGADAIRAYLSK